jgi:hypothetical protein
MKQRQEVIILREAGLVVFCKVFNSESTAFSYFQSLMEAMLSDDEMDELRNDIDASFYYDKAIKMLEGSGTEVEWLMADN